MPRPKQKPTRRVRLGIPLLLGAAFLAAAALYLRGRSADRFERWAAEGAPRLAGRVVEEPVRGNRHIPPGWRIRYPSPIPTSGPHRANDAPPGFYPPGKRPELARLVHNLEHGDVVIYYDAPGEAALDILRAWAERFPQPFQAVLVVPMPGLGAKVVLTAWGRRLELEPFDPSLAAAFIDRYRGRGPERRVR